MSDDIKALLNKAFSPEPTLSIDRDAILRSGRRQVRVRRFAASGGVAAAVVAVVLGAVVLVSKPGGGGDITPAQATSTRPADLTTPSSSGELAPAGPKLPLSTTPPVEANDRHAAELTKVLSARGVLPDGFELFPAEPDSAPLVFRLAGTAAYRSVAQLADAKGRGILVITVGPAYPTSGPPRCPNNPSCSELNVAGVAMIARTDTYESGAVEYSVLALRPDGTNLGLVATNRASTRMDDPRTTRPAPPLDLARLRAMATLPGLSYG